MEGFKPGEECTACQGKCCKETGCCLSPEDLQKTLKSRNIGKEESLYDQILSLLKEEQIQPLYAIDHFGTPKGPLYYLRMRHKCYTFIGIDAMGECTALTKEGCSLSQEQRPKGGRFLKSAPDRHCVQHYTREMMCEDWAPYQEILESIYKEYEVRFKEDGTFERCDADYFRWMREQREGK